MCRRNDMGPSQQSACLYDSSSLASKIFRLSAGHNIKCKLSAAAWVTANDQLRSPFSGFCVKLHLARSVVNDPHGPLFAVNKTQPPTSSAINFTCQLCSHYPNVLFPVDVDIPGHVCCWEMWAVLTYIIVSGLFYFWSKEYFEPTYQNYNQGALPLASCTSKLLLQQLKTIFRMHFSSVLS